MKRCSKSKLLHFFFDFWSDFWYKRNFFFLLVLLLLLILLVVRVFFSESLIIFFNVFLSYPFSQNISVRYSISAPKYFSEHIFVALARNPLNILVIVSGGIQECGLLCTFVRAGLRWTSNSYLSLEKFIDFHYFKISCFSCSVFSCVYFCFIKTMKLYKTFVLHE